SAMFVFFQSFSIIMALMFGSIAGVMSYIVLGRTIEEQRTNLGLFKALGMKSSEVIESLVVYGILLGIIGGVVGAILGALLGGMATSIMLQAFVRLPINQSTQIDFITVFLYILISVVLCMGSSILATRKITKLTPQAAIRPDISQKVEKNAAIEHFLPIKLSPLRKFSLRTIFRRKRKTTITFFAIFLAVSVIFFSFAFMSLYNGSLNSRFSTYEQWDIQVTFNKEISSANISEDLGLKTFPNTIVEPVILTSIRFSKDITNPIPVIGIKDQSEMRKFDTPNYPQDNAIFVTKDLLYKDNLAINSYINVLLPSNINKSIKVSEALSEGISDTIYTNLDTAREFAGMKLSDGVNSAYIKTTNINDVKGLIQNNLNVDKITLKSDVKDVYYTTYEIYLETFAMIMFAGIIIGIAIIVTIVSISISERKIDFINFRSLGVTNHEIFNIIAVELFMIGLFGIIFGLFGGIALMSIMLEIMVRIGFPIQMSYNILDFLGTIIVAILTIVFSTYLSLRSLFRENIARATLERMLG
ncbi:MAG: ABC transporter permease, partial [Candidatus Thorarchaeota archaeon]